MKTQKTNTMAQIYSYYMRKGSAWRANQTDKEITKYIFDYFRGEGGELVAVEKNGQLAKTFWIGEGYCAGRSFDEAQEICRDINQNKEANFIEVNTNGVNGVIAKINKYIGFLNHENSCLSCSDLFYFSPMFEDSANPLRYIISNLSGWDTDSRKDLKPLSLADAKQYRAILIRKKEDLEKRCKSYLKRYGTDKIYASTYWADR